MNEYVKIPNIYERETCGKNRLIEGKFSSKNLEYLKDNEWFWTEKVDGTNIRVIWDGYRVSFKSRTDKSDIPKHLLTKLEELFGGTDKEEIFEEKFGMKIVIMYGEGFGTKIQKNGDLYGDVDFILFDVVIDGNWLSYSNVTGIAEYFGIRTVPMVGSGTLSEAVEFIRTHPASLLRDFEMEGIVCRPLAPLFNRDGSPILVKIKCRDFKRS